RRYVSGVIGAGVGSMIGGAIAPGIGHAAGGGGAHLAGKKIAQIADERAMQRAVEFVKILQGRGSQKLRKLLGDQMANHLYGTPKGEKAVTNWIKTLGTPAATRALAITIASEVRQRRLVPRIEQELNGVVQELQNQP